MPRLIPHYAFVGIDPGGSSGAISTIYTDRLRKVIKVDVKLMPKDEKGIWGVFDEITYDTAGRPKEWGGKEGRLTVVVAHVEEVQAYAKQQAKSSFSFGRNYGAVLVACAAGGIEPIKVRPQVWQASLGITPRFKPKRAKGKKPKRGEPKPESDTEWKQRLMLLAVSLYPNLPCWKAKTVGVRRRPADSLLIAEYGRRTWNK